MSNVLCIRYFRTAAAEMTKSKSMWFEKQPTLHRGSYVNENLAAQQGDVI